MMGGSVAGWSTYWLRVIWMVRRSGWLSWRLATVQLLENREWVEQQFGGCRLGNVLRTKRLAIMATNMLECPEASLPRQNSNWSDMKAAYHLCDRPEVTFEAVAQCHWKRVRQTKPGRYLLISDTTDIDHFRHRATTGLGFLGDGVGRGMQLHSSLVVDCSQGVVQGMAGALLHYRKRVPTNETRMQRLGRKRESQVWGDLVDKIGPPPESSQWIHVFDRGGDNFEALCHILDNRGDWVIRAAKMNRQVVPRDGESLPLSTAIGHATELGRYELSLRSRPGQAARTANIMVSAIRVTLPRPVHHSKYVKRCGIKSIETNVVVVQEVNAPQGLKPICWVLLTSLPVDTFAQAWQVIEDYECRWLIEEYHKVLKSGCSIESHALRTADRLEALMGLITVVAVRLLQLKTIAKQTPATKARHRVPAKWLAALKQMRPRVLLSELTVYQFIRELAKLGGFPGRKHDGEPGWQTIWRGYAKLQLIVQGMLYAQKKNNAKLG